VLFCSLPLQLLAHRAGLLAPGYINLEYLLIGALGVFLPRRVVFVLLFLESLIDLASAICKTYYFSLGDLISVLHSFPALPGYRRLELLGGLVLIILICAVTSLARPRPADRIKTAVSLLLLIIICIFCAFLMGQDTLLRRNTIYLPVHLVRSPAVSLIRRGIEDHKRDLASSRPNHNVMVSASAQAIAFLDRPGGMQPPNVVLIVVESWGLANDARLAQSLVDPYGDSQIARKYEIAYGTVPFDGWTVPGEARELCHSKMGYGIVLASPERLNDCLPSLLHQHGYKEISVHGFSGRLFRRSIWYTNIGFDRSWFEPDLEKAGLAHCDGAFPGICDASIAEWIGSSVLSADEKQPRFVYWVTLNSHLPVPANPNVPEDGICATQPALRDSKPLCSWFRLVRALHKSVQQLALRPTARPTVFILVGDHAPPFADPQLRQQFSATGVPYVILTPRTAASQ